MILGLDVSNYQGNLNWRTLASSYNLGFSFAKASEGTTFKDAYFVGNWAGINAVGLVRGAYHFARPERSSGRAQADFFLSCIPNLVYGDKLILDLEETQLSSSATNAWAVEWALRITERTGQVPGIYTGSYLKNSTGAGFNKVFSWWWFPTYPNVYRPTTLHPDYIITPPSPNIWGRQPDMWQFTDKFAGVFDASVYNGTAAQLRAVGARGEPDMPLTDADIARLCGSDAFKNTVIDAVWNLSKWPEGDNTVDAGTRLARAANHPSPDEIANAVVAKLLPTPAGGGATAAQVKEAVRQVLTEGTGGTP